MTIWPCHVQNGAPVRGLAMELLPAGSAGMYRYFRRQSKRGRLPASLGSEFGDVGGVMIAMPGIEEEHPVEGADAVIGMAESAGEFIGSNGAQQANPTLVKRVEQLRESSGGAFRASSSLAQAASSYGLIVGSTSVRAKRQRM